MKNQAQVKYHRKLRELWSWMARECATILFDLFISVQNISFILLLNALTSLCLEFEELPSESKTHTGTDYNFQGIHTVWMGPNGMSHMIQHPIPNALSSHYCSILILKPITHHYSSFSGLQKGLSSLHAQDFTACAPIRLSINSRQSNIARVHVLIFVNWYSSLFFGILIAGS